MTTSPMKKDLQKVISHIRGHLRVEEWRNTEYPKAMFTAQQEAKRTATVNCGQTFTYSRVLSERVIEDERFQAFLTKYDGL